MSITNHPIPEGHVVAYRFPAGFRNELGHMAGWLRHYGFSPESAGPGFRCITLPEAQIAGLRELQRSNPARFGNPPTDEKRYFVSKTPNEYGLPRVLDIATPLPNGLLVGSMDPSVNEFTIDAGVEVVPSSLLLERTRTAARSHPEEISQDAYLSALGSLPPHRSWGTGFAMSEFYTADITWIYQVVDDRFFRFRDQASIPKDLAELRVRESHAFLHPASDDANSDESFHP